MNEPLDQKEEKVEINKSPLKLINSVLLIISVGIVLFTVWRVWISNNTGSPWLPEYTRYFINGTLINFTVILLIGILPAFVFRILKHYSTSIFLIVAFMVLGLIFDDQVQLYHYFY